MRKFSDFSLFKRKLKRVKIGKKSIIIVLLFFSAMVVKSHPFYVSICQMEYNSETKALEISLKTFADDLILGLENAGHTGLYIGEARENPKTDEILYNYLQSVLQFNVNGQSVNYNFIGKELEDGVVWSYLEITNINNFNELEVRCSLLTEVLESQSNIIQVEKNKKIKNLLLSVHQTRGKVLFDD